ncbi:MAG: zinc ribbon domain-containing protein [Dokdonella sp.]
MPIYEFECSACNERFERLQKIADPDPSVCPQCGKANVRRRISAPSFRLAGSGWYETDFKKEGDIKRNLAESDSAPAASSPVAEPVKKAEPVATTAGPSVVSSGE